MDRAASHHVDGVSRTEVQRTYRLEHAQEALDTFTQGTLGKVVVTTVWASTRSPEHLHRSDWPRRRPGATMTGSGGQCRVATEVPRR